METTRIVWLVVLGGCFAANFSPAQTWLQTSAPINSWRAVASSADGTQLAAMGGGSSLSHFSVFGGPIYALTDSGATWTSNRLPVPYWNGSDNTSVAFSADGARLFVLLNSVPNGGGLWKLPSTLPPFISVRPANGSLALSWLVPSTNLILQRSSDSQNWSVVMDQPVLNFTNLQDEVSLPITNGKDFFRLATP